MAFVSLSRLSWWCIALLICLAIPTAPLRAVQDNGGYNTADPGANVANWTSGWPSMGLTGWSYVGQVNGSSGVYLGNGWVLTAGHVGVGNFTLNGVTYSAIGSSAALINGGSVDLVLFQVVSPPPLPSLPLGQLVPTPFSASHSGDSVVMVGFGGGQGKTWGANTVTGIDKQVSLSLYTSIDFYTTYGTTTIGGQSVTNQAQVVTGDSGGAGFVRNASTGKWQLAGMTEATGPAAYFVQIGTYVQPILDITGLAAPPVIEAEPVGASVPVGSAVSLSVTANGSNPLSYQWLKNGSSVSGATAATLTFAHASLGDSGSYSVIVTNSYGSATSSAVTVIVSSPVPATPAWALVALPVLLLVICHRYLRHEPREPRIEPVRTTLSRDDVENAVGDPSRGCWDEGGSRWRDHIERFKQSRSRRQEDYDEDDEGFLAAKAPATASTSAATSEGDSPMPTVYFNAL